MDDKKTTPMEAENEMQPLTDAEKASVNGGMFIPAPQWVCPKCGNLNGGTFPKCAKCGKKRP